MKILLSGGGSGGHITPLLAVAAELKQLQPDIHIIYVGQRGDKLADIPAQDKNIDEVYTVRAGKFRRYHGEGIKQVLDVRTVFKNTRDAGRVILGLNESRRLLKRLRPDLIFIKGGFVGVPVGLAAAQLHIPFITHDSDVLPGLANRIIARWATLHAVALPKETYPYPQDKTVTVGVPVAGEYQPVTSKLQQEYQHELDLDNFKQVILVTGGGLGAQRLNEAMTAVVPELLGHNSDLAVLHLVGREHVADIQQTYDKLVPGDQLNHVIVKGFVMDLYRYSGAADVIVARAGATNLAEFAIQAKACVIVPNPQLTGGHQLKNTQVLTDHQAVQVITEAQLASPDGLQALRKSLQELLDSPAKRQELGQRLAQFAHPNAAKELAQLLLKTLS